MFKRKNAKLSRTGGSIFSSICMNLRKFRRNCYYATGEGETKGKAEAAKSMVIYLLVVHPITNTIGLAILMICH
jgi:hypothetical protein